MKKVIIISILLFCSSSIFAASALLSFINDVVDITVEETKENILEIKPTMDFAHDPLIKEIKNRTFDASNMSYNDKISFYDEHKVNPFGPSMLNLFVGFGIGNKKVHDLISSNAFLIADSLLLGIGGSAIVITGTVWLCGSLFTFASPDAQEQFNKQISDVMAIGGLTTLGALGITHLVSFILTFTSASSFNKDLKASLGLTEDLQLAIGPTMNGGMQIAASISF